MCSTACSAWEKLAFVRLLLRQAVICVLWLTPHYPMATHNHRLALYRATKSGPLDAPAAEPPATSSIQLAGFSPACGEVGFGAKWAQLTPALCSVQLPGFWPACTYATAILWSIHGSPRLQNALAGPHAAQDKAMLQLGTCGSPL